MKQSFLLYIENNLTGACRFIDQFDSEDGALQSPVFTGENEVRSLIELLEPINPRT